MSNMFRHLSFAVLFLIFPAAMLADFTQSNVTLQSGQALNLETGAIATSGGDIKFNGNSITFVGSATGLNWGATQGPGGYALLSQATLAAAPGLYSIIPISGAKSGLTQKCIPARS